MRMGVCVFPYGYRSRGYFNSGAFVYHYFKILEYFYCLCSLAYFLLQSTIHCLQSIKRSFFRATTYKIGIILSFSN